MPLDVYKDWLGIPDGPRPPDHYQLLRLKQYEDSVDRIRANYKKLNGHVRKYATGQYLDESQALLNELAKAMLCLTDLERKREYDVSQGRVFEEEEAGPRTMDQVLLEHKSVTAEQIKQAHEHSERTGLELRDSFVQLKLVPPDLAAQALAQELGIPYVDLGDTFPDDGVLDQIPKATVKQHSILPLLIDEGVLMVACVREIDHELEDELRLRFGVPVRPVLASPPALTQAINKYYASGAREERDAQREAAKAASAADASAKSGEKKAPGKPKKSEPEIKKKEPPRRKGPMTQEERKNQRMIGVVIVNFSFLAAYLLDTFVVGQNKVDFWLYLVIPGIAAAFSYLAYWK